MVWGMVDTMDMDPLVTLFMMNGGQKHTMDNGENVKWVWKENLGWISLHSLRETLFSMDQIAVIQVKNFK